MWYVCDVLYAVLYVRVSCVVVRGCAVSRGYIDGCHCNMFSVVKVCPDHLKFCAVCSYCRRYVCCGEFNVVSNEYDETTPALCNLSVQMVVKLCTFGVLVLRVCIVS